MGGAESRDYFGSSDLQKQPLAAWSRGGAGAGVGLGLGLGLASEWAEGADHTQEGFQRRGQDVRI